MQITTSVPASETSNGRPANLKRTASRWPGVDFQRDIAVVHRIRERGHKLVLQIIHRVSGECENARRWTARSRLARIFSFDVGYFILHQEIVVYQSTLSIVVVHVVVGARSPAGCRPMITCRDGTLLSSRNGGGGSSVFCFDCVVVKRY